MKQAGFIIDAINLKLIFREQAELIYSAAYTL